MGAEFLRIILADDNWLTKQTKGRGRDSGEETYTRSKDPVGLRRAVFPSGPFSQGFFSLRGLEGGGIGLKIGRR